MIFVYEAANESGGAVVGELEAVSKKAALRELHAKGLTVTQIDSRVDQRHESTRKSTQQDLLLSLHEMATLLESGVSVAETIDAQARANYPEDLHIKYQNMADEIRMGSSFSAGLETVGFELPDYFPQLVKAGELTGSLALSLREGVSQFEYDLRVREDFRSAMIYPSVLVASGVAAVLLIFVFVVPKFAPLVSRSDDLPLLSTIVLSSGMWFNDNIGLVILLGALLAGLCSWALAQAHIREKVISFCFGIPVIGTWLHESDIATWTSLMSTLLNAKVDLMQALGLARASVKNERRKSLLGQVEKEIRGGQGLADSLESTGTLTPTGYNLIRSGERTGKLPEMMRSVATLYEDAAKTRMKRLLALIEPLAILFIGGVIGVIILGVILAITSVNELVV